MIYIFIVFEILFLLCNYTEIYFQSQGLLEVLFQFYYQNEIMPYNKANTTRM